MPSDEGIFFVEVEHFSLIVLWHGQNSEVLVFANVFADGDDSVALNLGLNLELLSAFESSVLWSIWDIADLPLLVFAAVTTPVGIDVVLLVLSSPNLSTHSSISSVVESLGSCVVVDRLLS